MKNSSKNIAATIANELKADNKQEATKQAAQQEATKQDKKETRRIIGGKYEAIRQTTPAELKQGDRFCSLGGGTIYTCEGHGTMKNDKGQTIETTTILKQDWEPSTQGKRRPSYLLWKTASETGKRSIKDTRNYPIFLLRELAPAEIEAK